jgi:hypothetical protein
VETSTKRKWQFWISTHGLCWGDRSTGEYHTQIGFVWVALVGFGLYEMISAAIKLSALADKL